MLQKRDLQLIRLAVRRKWLTPEEGEDCLFLKRKFGAKYTIEEVVRRRGYLDEDALQQLGEDTDKLLNPRGRRGLFGKKAEEAHEEEGAEAPTGPPPPPAPPAPAPAKHRVATTAAAKQTFRSSFAPPAAEAPPAEEEPPSSILDGSTRVVRMDDILPNLQKEEPSALDQPFSEVADRTVVDSSILQQLQQHREMLEARRKAESAPKPAKPAEIEIEVELDQPAQPPKPKGVKDERTTVGLVDTSQLKETRRDVPRAPSVQARKAEPPAPPPPPRAPSLEKRRAPPVAPSVARARSGAPAMPPPPPKEELATVQSLEALREEAPPPVAVEVPPPRAPSRAASAVRPPPLSDDLPSADFGPYLIKRTIAQGGMSTVYLAEPKAGGAPVAIKILKQALARDVEHLARFLRESQAAASIDSPHVVKQIDVGTISGRHYLAMEYVEGWTLAEKLDAEEKPDMVQGLKIARDVARALEAAWRVGIIHRDVKPENVMITGEGRVVLMDFGLAKDTKAGATMMDAKDLVVGTPNYMSPEQGLGHRVDTRADLYSLGATMFHMITGKPLFPGSSAVSIVAKHVNVPAPDLTSIDQAVPAPVSMVVKRLLEKNPDDRFPDATSLIQILDQVIADLERPELAIARAREAAKARSVSRPAMVVSAVAIVLSLALPKIVVAAHLVPWERPVTLLRTALAGALFVGFAFLLAAVLGLVRRGELGLPGSTALLVGVMDFAGALGAGLLAGSVMVAPPAVINVVVSALGVLALGSWIYGILLRRRIAALRPDRGIGHMLAVLGDPKLLKWRRIHVPVMTALVGLSIARWALLAYFQATGLG